MTVRILTGDCREVLAGMEPESFDSAVTDPPYHLSTVKRYGSPDAKPTVAGVYGRSTAGFMGQAWDAGDVAFRPETWAAVYRVLKPGAHLIAFGGTRTQHRLVCAIEDAGFEIRDQIGWAYGSGFPKSLDVSKAIDKAAGAEREVLGDSPFAARKPNGSAGVYSVGLSDTPGHVITAPATPEAAAWQGWGTALKPAWEPICVARKPLVGTVAGNVLAHGTGALNIDGCRIEAAGRPLRINAERQPAVNVYGDGLAGSKAAGATDLGRWPANLIHDGSDEVLACFPESGNSWRENKGAGLGYHSGSTAVRGAAGYHGAGSAARFFYTAKASSSERGEGNTHPTVKPTALMRYLVRLVTPPGGHVLDPFGGSGSTGIAADQEQFHATLIDLDPAYAKLIADRIKANAGLFAEVAAE